MVSMLDIPLQDIITAHTDSLAAHAEEYLPLIRLLLLQGAGPVSPERLETAMHWTPLEVEAFLHSLGLVVDAEGDIQMGAGSGCALDTLLAPMLTGHAARVVSICPATGTQIHLTATPEGVRDLNHPGAVLSLRLPSSETSASNAPATICAYGHFFVDREAASTWPGLHPEAVLLAVGDAARLAQEIAKAAHRYAEKAEF
jgi:alkylmercury lyase